MEGERDQIFTLLTEAGICTTKDISRILEMPPRKVRAHAAELMESGEIYGHKVGGGWVYWHPKAGDKEGNVRQEHLA
jgi:predicted ArsR family transcriptional regulator